MQHVLRPSSPHAHDGSPSIFRRHFTATFDDSGHKSGWTDDATEGGLDVGTKGEASFHIARWKEGEREQLVSLPPKISALAKADVDDATFRGRIDEVGNRQARGRRDRSGGCLPFWTDARFSN